MRKSTRATSRQPSAMKHSRAARSSALSCAGSSLAGTSYRIFDDQSCLNSNEYTGRFSLSSRKTTSIRGSTFGRRSPSMPTVNSRPPM